jgi:ATP-binding cassette subfamily C protein
MMSLVTAARTPEIRSGQAELTAARTPVRVPLALVFLFSAAVNLLMLTPPLYMLQVYDRVLASRSEETLVALSLLATALFAIMGVLDHARGRILARIGAGLQERLEARVHDAALRRLASAPGDRAALAAPRDLDALTRFWASPVLPALCDAPWAPLYLAAIFVFHPLLGWLAVAGGAMIVLISWANQRTTRAPQEAAGTAALAAEREALAQGAEAELMRALGMSAAGQARCQALRLTARDEGLVAADLAGRWATLARTFRLYLQSAMLGVAAWLVLQDQLSAGAMLAASVLMGRALQPLELAVGRWSVVSRARQARLRLAELLSACPALSPRTALPRPTGWVEVRDLAVQPPGAARPVLRGISFSLRPGQALGVIGPSGAGKSALARVLTGALPPAAGQVRLDGAPLDQYGPERLGPLVGYLPQRSALFDGSLAENIARLAPDAPAERIIAAARAAAAHEMILDLPEGYDTRVTAQGTCLSGGQIQRICLARALYGDPVLLVLDEPNAHLDNDGALALNRAIGAAKAAGAAVVVMAHRPLALQECDQLLVLKEGAVAAFGPRDAVLRDQVRNAGDIARAIGLGAAG